MRDLQCISVSAHDAHAMYVTVGGMYSPPTHMHNYTHSSVKAEHSDWVTESVIRARDRGR